MQQMVAWRRLGSAVASAAAVLAMAGCAGAEPGVVAYVGDDRITESQLDRALAGLDAVFDEGQRVDRDAVVNALIQGELAEQIAAARNIRVTDAERDALIRPSDLGPLLDNADAKPVAYDIADSQLVSRQVGAEQYLNALKASSVTLNPRYGVLDPDRKVITGAEQTGSLSTPAAIPVEAP